MVLFKGSVPKRVPLGHLGEMSGELDRVLQFGVRFILNRFMSVMLESSKD